MSNQYIEQDSKSNSYLDKLTDKKILKLELFRLHLYYFKINILKKTT